MATLKAVYEKEHRHNRFVAAMQGVDIDENKSKEDSEEPVTFEEVKARAIARFSGNDEAANAARYGFDELDGVGYTLLSGE